MLFFCDSSVYKETFACHSCQRVMHVSSLRSSIAILMVAVVFAITYRYLHLGRFEELGLRLQDSPDFWPDPQVQSSLRISCRRTAKTQHLSATLPPNQCPPPTSTPSPTSTLLTISSTQADALQFIEGKSSFLEAAASGHLMLLVTRRT